MTIPAHERIAFWCDELHRYRPRGVQERTDALLAYIQNLPVNDPRIVDLETASDRDLVAKLAYVDVLMITDEDADADALLTGMANAQAWSGAPR